jgi:3-phosphoshikimate 1-carboxyvinyltransferase
VTAASQPARGPFRLTPRLPGDKSITHRAFLLGAIGRATLRAAVALGASVRESGNEILIEGRSGRFTPPTGPLDLGNSGTGLRLLLGLLAPQTFTSVLTGDASLSRRPVERVLAPLRLMGVRAEAPGDHPPVTLHGGALHGIRYALPVPSAQVRSAILLAGMQADGTTVVEGGEGARDHTERLLPAFGIAARRLPGRVEVDGPRVPDGTTVSIPGDPSAGAFYLAAAALVPESEVILEGICLNPLRTKSFDVLSRMGLDLVVEPDAGDNPEPVGRVTATGRALRGVRLAPDEIPGVIDELPILAVAAALADGETVVAGAGELKHKESDRLRTVAAGLEAIGGTIRLHEDGWTITGTGGKPLPGGTVHPEGDHRIAMAFLIAGLATRRGVRLAGETGIETSDPFFMDNLDRIARGGEAA